MPPKNFRCYLVTKDAEGKVSGEITERPLEELPAGEVLIRVNYSSLNYKDALGATGHPGVNRVFPHIPGVDAAGCVAASDVSEFVEGDPVLVTGFDMGSNRWGGYAEYVRVPRDWVVPLPDGLSLKESMMLGTAGLTAGFCVDALVRHDVGTDRGPVLVTGASGGVGSVAVAILAKLGYEVAAVTGKPEAAGYLQSLGAAEILAREDVDDPSDKPFLPERWAGAVDTVGGKMLADVLRAAEHGGCVAACGNVGGVRLETTVFPFILRGVILAGIDSVRCPMRLRHETWEKLAGPWKPDCLEEISEIVALETLPERFDEILASRIAGRVVVKVTEENA